MSDVALIELHLELGELLLPPGVEGDLGGGVTARLLQLLVELVQFSPELTTALVSSSPGGSLRLKLLVQLLQPGLQLLDLGVELPCKC